MSREIITDAAASVFAGYAVWAMLTTGVDAGNLDDMRAAQSNLDACSAALSDKSDSISSVPVSCEAYDDTFINTESGEYQIPDWRLFNKQHENDLEPYHDASNRHSLMVFPIGGIAVLMTYKLLAKRRTETNDESDEVELEEEDYVTDYPDEYMEPEEIVESKPAKRGKFFTRIRESFTEEKIDFSRLADSYENQELFDDFVEEKAAWLGIVAQLTKK